MKKYRYVVVSIADEYYEEGKYVAMFDTYDDTKDFLFKYKMLTLMPRLDWLEDNKDTFREYDGHVDLVVSYS